MAQTILLEATEISPLRHLWQQLIYCRNSESGVLLYRMPKIVFCFFCWGREKSCYKTSVQVNNRMGRIKIQHV